MKEEALNHEELRLFSRRDAVIKTIISIPFAVITWRLWDLQIKKGGTFKELAKGNRIRLKSIYAPRGIIYDSAGEIVSKNIPSYNLMLTREDTRNIPATLQKVSRVLKIPLIKLQKAFNEKKNTAKFQPILIYKDLTWYQMAIISTYQEEFLGISIDVISRRFYPMTKSAAHVLGYMNKINKEQLKKLPKNQIKSAQIVGQEGVERIYNNRLIGKDGGVQVEVDSTGRVMDTLKSIDPIPGNDIKLAINSRFQRKIETIFGNRRGAAVVMNPQTGEVLSMVSLPSFDPNEFSRGLSVSRWNELTNDPSHILNNKCIQGMYSPGSTFKMLMAAAALEEGIIDENTEHTCDGVYRFNRLRVHCWNRGGHGKLNVVGAIENSCNIFFYKVGIELGVNTIKKYASRFGLGHLTDIDLRNEKSGVVPDREWKKNRYKEAWYAGETLPVSIGQGYLSVTPLQLLSYINVIANGGYIVKPRIVDEIVSNYPDSNRENGIITKVEKTPIVKRKIDIKDSTLDILRMGMIKNVQTDSGTGKHARSNLVSIAGKTGTTQVVSFKTRAKIKREKGSIDSKYFNHAWFVGFAPIINPKLSVAVLIENGKSGSNSARLTKQLIEYYFTEIEPLPAQSDDRIIGL